MSGNEISSYCREIEAYLCRKNDGHLIRVVGPSFELVSRWAAEGVPLKIAFRGIDRYFERYYRAGPRRRPVKIDFCEADVLDAFDEWRRAVGITAGLAARGAAAGAADARGQQSTPGTAIESGQGPGRGTGDSARGTHRSVSLPTHLERALLKLSSARAGGAIGAEFDLLLDRIGRELDLVRAEARGLRGDARQAAIERLEALDAELLAVARQSISADDYAALAREADGELAAYRATMAESVYQRARSAAVDRLIRDRFNLPVLGYRP